MEKSTGIKHNVATASKSETVESCQPRQTGTVLVMGDSMLNNIHEKYLERNCLMKVRSFSGSTVRDLKNYYMIPLLRKKPVKVIVHIGTSDASYEGASSDTILAEILDACLWL